MARRLIGIFIISITLLLPHAALAQKGQQIFDFFLQQADREVQRQQQREHERSQRQEQERFHQQFLLQWHACQADNLDGCDQALSYPYLTARDRQVLVGKRASIVAAQVQHAERLQRERIETERAEFQRRRIETERIEAERRVTIEAERRAAEVQANRVTVMQALIGQEQKQKQQSAAATLAPSWVPSPATMFFAMVLAIVWVFCDAVFMRAYWDRVRNFWPFVAPVSSSVPPHAAPEAQHNFAAANDTSRPPPLPVTSRSRDTIGAIAALELAHAYIEEVRHADMPRPEDSDGRKHQLNTLALASRQLDAAQRLDPDAILEVQEPDGSALRYSINELKAEALLIEGLTHQSYDIKRAIPALVAATKHDPNHAHAFFVLGLTHASNRNKKAALAALQSAVALDPGNISYRKELNRTESLSASEIAGYRATRAGERIVDASITGWNIFAFVWNVVMFPLRVVVTIFRFLGLNGFR